MKKVVLFILFLKITCLLQGQDLIYTIDSDKNGKKTFLDSILVENLTNGTEILFDNLPESLSYQINLTQQTLEKTTSLFDIKNNEVFKTIKNIPGEVRFQCLNTHVNDIALTVYKVNGQKLYQRKINPNNISNTVSVYLPGSEMYLLHVHSNFGEETIKALGSGQLGAINYAFNQNNEKQLGRALKSGSFKNETSFSYEKNDSLRITANYHGKYTIPLDLKINASDSLHLLFALEGEYYPDIKGASSIKVQDSIVWVGTYYGLYRFEGDSMTIYTETDGLIDNSINVLAVSDNGTLWVGTEGGLSKFENETWTNYTVDDGLHYNSTRSLNCDKDDNVWIGTGGSMVVKFDGISFAKYLVNPEYPQSTGGHIHTITNDFDGNLWVGNCMKGFSKFDGEVWDHNLIDKLNYAWALSSICSNDGVVWLGYLMGATKYANGVFTQYTEEDGLVDNCVLSLTIDNQNNIWFGTQGGISKFDGTNWSSFTIKRGLPDNRIEALACDKNGDIWVATSHYGLMKITND